MTGLVELQRRFQAYVLDSSRPAPAMIAGTGDAPAERRLAVYSEAIVLRFHEALSEDYPGVRASVGDEAFRALADAYAAAHPSRHRSIRWFGRHLPGYVRNNAPWNAHPVLAEMAAFEWAKGELLDAADSALVTVEDVAAIPADCWAAMRPRLVPALRRLTLEWNVPALWIAVDSGETPPPTRQDRPVDWLLWRHGIHVRWRSLDCAEAWALQACTGGADFDAICGGLSEQLGEDAAALRAATCLKQWANDGLLAGL